MTDRDAAPERVAGTTHRLVVLGEQVFTAAGYQPPCTFEVAWAPSLVYARMSCAVPARIEEDGELRLVSDRRQAAITHGTPAHAGRLLRWAGTGTPQRPPPRPLRGGRAAVSAVRLA